MRRSQKLFVSLKAIILMIVVVLMSTCAMFQDFLAPSDLVAGVEAQYGVQISDAKVSKSVVRNTGSDMFIVSCTTISKPSINNVVIDISSIGGNPRTFMSPQTGNANNWMIELAIGEDYSESSYTFTITAVNSANYTNTADVSVNVFDINSYCVSVDGDNNNIGTANSPFATIQHAIGKAVEYGVKSVYVSTGTYTNRYDNDEYCVELKEDVAIYGGWNTNFTDRNTANNPTIIDGKQTAQHVVIAEKVFDTEAGIDGFVIIGGQSTTKGGGLYLKTSSVFVKNSIISNNSALEEGGAIFTKAYEGLIQGNTFVDNTAFKGGAVFFLATENECLFIENVLSNNCSTNYGGAIYTEQSSLHIISNTISSNKSDYYGGGLYINNYSTLIMEGNTISNNFANDGGSGGSGGGGCFINLSTPVLSNNIITCNKANGRGGGIFLEEASAIMTSNIISYNTVNNNNGGGLYLNNSSPTMVGNIIIKNTGWNGGGMYIVYYSSPTMMYNTISSNSASSGNGGGMCIENSSPTMMYNTICSNNAILNGGGMFLSGFSPTIICNSINNNTANQDGGGICIYSSSPTIICNSINNNTANQYGGGMYFYWSLSTNIQNLILDNSGAKSNIIYIDSINSKLVFISNIIGSTNHDGSHYGIYEADAITGHTLQYNFFVTNALGFLYRRNDGGETNNIDALNDGGVWTGATGNGGATNNYVTNRIGAMTIWSNWQSP